MGDEGLRSEGVAEERRREMKEGVAVPGYPSDPQIKKGRMPKVTPEPPGSAGAQMRREACPSQWQEPGLFQEGVRTLVCPSF